MRSAPRAWSWTVTFVLVAGPALAQVPDRPAPAGSPSVSGRVAAAPDDPVATSARRTPRRHRVRPLIELFAPEVEGALLSAIPAELLVGREYLGDGALAFSLVAGPAGMAVETDSGVLTWTPPTSAEGTEVQVRVRASDESYTAEVAFPLKVATARNVATSLQGSKLTVTANGSLQGLAFTFPVQVSPQPSQVSVVSIGPTDAPDLPEGITKLTDFFRLTPVAAQGEDGIVVMLPARLVPSGVLPQALRLYVYSGEAEDTEGPAWLAVSNELDVQPHGAVTLTAYALGELCFVGYETAARGLAFEPLRAPTGPTPIHVGPSSVSVSCQNLILASGAPDPRAQVCNVTGDVSMTVTIRDFLPNAWKPSTTLEELMGWLVAARQRIATYGMSADSAFFVTIETLKEKTGLGLVRGGVERRKVLHLTNRSVSKATIMGTAVHEYFHHAQSRSRIAGRSSLIDQGKSAEWLTEGTARWFEDEVFDSADTYKLKEREPLQQVLWPGLGARPAGTLGTRSYCRFAFMKLAFSRCPGFDLPHVFNVDASNDPTGLGGFTAALRDPAWRCDFGAGLGTASRATPQAALALYEWATVFSNSIAVLDPNESGFTFNDHQETLIPYGSCVSAQDCPWGARLDAYRIPPMGARAIGVLEIPWLDTDERIRVDVEKSSTIDPNPWVWIGADGAGFESGRGYEVADRISHSYGETGAAPPMMIIVVNPSTTTETWVNVRTGIVKAAELTFTFPERVLTVGSCVTWTAKVVIQPLGVAGLTVKAGLAPPTGNQINLDITGKGVTLPNPFVVSGTFDADPSSLTGTCVNRDGNRIRWTYSNKQIEHSENGTMVTGPAFRFELAATGPNPLKWSSPVIVYYDRKIEWLNSDGSVYRTTFQAKASEAVLYVNVDINSP